MSLKFESVLDKELASAWGESVSLDVEEVLSSQLLELFGESVFSVLSVREDRSLLALEIDNAKWPSPFVCCLDAQGHLSYDRRP